ncbi:S8 family peptidase [Halorubrum kocurii]|uniref:Peptidase S8 and S53 subtilisin kexin sedolisin n=1 Tax=Halorubrum kocurii JCM 14978 TaxID=1230456 RepID=M0NK53_9EURY|nr:S8 family serine peptidase [Halorubrum kocurii]EMA58362.1 peptidase S8 and S53 subtilisin kexin sedolisin [Halorubrum kocurii JCM 14978]
MPNTTKRTFLKLSGSLLGGIALGTTVTAAERTDRFIVSTKEKAKLSDLTVVHEMPGIDYAVVRGGESSVKRAVSSYAPDVQIELDSPDVNEEAPTLDASDYEGQPGDFLQWDKADLDVPEAHETTEGEDTRVSVIDSGVLETHPDLAGPLNLDLSRNFTDDGGDHNPVGGDDHGTHVAGIVAADNGGGIGVNGTAPKTDLVDCRVFSGPTASFGDILAAVVYSANVDADVANLSLGAYPVPRQAQGQFYGKVLNSTMTYANKEGTLLVIAAGNDSADLQHDKNFISLPNEGAQALSVASTGPIGYEWDADDDGEVADVAAPPESPAFYTNYGTNAITLAAPGGDADLDATGTDVPWFNDLVFNTVYAHNGSLTSGTFGSKSGKYGGNVTAMWTGDSDGSVAVSGSPPSTTDDVPWYSSVGFGGVEFTAGGNKFNGDETITVEYETGPEHERHAPDWISVYLTVPPAGDEDPTNYVAVDWQVSEDSGSTVSWTANDTFGDGSGGVFEASNVVEIFSDNDIDPSSPNAAESDVIGSAVVTGVGVFSGGGVGRDDSVDITYTGVAFEGEDLLIPQTPGYSWKAGTSMAAPNVAGAAALVKSANPDYNANQVEAALKKAAEVPDDYGKEYYGAGYLNILDAL